MIAPRSTLPQIHKFFAVQNATNPAVRLAIFFSAIFLIRLFCAFAPAIASRVQSPSTTWMVTIVLPEKVVAGQPATLAVLGLDGRLAPKVAVEVSSDVGDPQRVVTDPTGRAYFTTPSSGSVLFARAPGGSAAALIDSARPAVSLGITTEPVVSLRDRFSICGSGLRGDADAILVRLNREPSLVIAASPECIVVLPSNKVEPGPAQVSVEASGNQLSSNTTLVSLDFESPNPVLVPGTKSRLSLRVSGSDKQLRIAVDNKTPGVLRFLQGDVQEVLSTGGPRNSATLPIEVIRSGDFSFHARLLAAADTETALRYLKSAETLAPKDLQRGITNLTERLEHHPQDSGKVRENLEQILSMAIPGDFRTLLDAAHSAL